MRKQASFRLESDILLPHGIRQDGSLMPRKETETEYLTPATSTRTSCEAEVAASGCIY